MGLALARQAVRAGQGPQVREGPWPSSVAWLQELSSAHVLPATSSGSGFISCRLLGLQEKAAGRAHSGCRGGSAASLCDGVPKGGLYSPEHAACTPQLLCMLNVRC